MQKCLQAILLFNYQLISPETVKHFINIVDRQRFVTESRQKI